MTLAEIEEIAKALAPVFKNALKVAIDEQKKALECIFLEKIGELRKEFSASMPAPLDLSGFATKEFVTQSVSENRLAMPDVETLVKEVVNQDGERLKAELMEVIANIPPPKAGEPGENGKSVEIADVLPVLNQLVATKFAELPPPDVAPIVDAAVAKAVAEIPRPQDGASVSVEDVLPQINAEIARKFAELPPPKNGKNGLDALDIMILPAIDFAKSYPRGAFATHNGGLWKSHSQTEGERGWDCIVRGVGDVALEQRNERNFVLVYTDTVGNKKEFHLQVPTMVYRNIWREGTTYERGDTVTWGGSMWHCNKETDVKPGEGQDAWTLATKKGRDLK